MKDVAVDLAVLTARAHLLSALLVRLPGSHWALPSVAVGGGATLEAAALEALAEQTGVSGVALEQLYTFDRAGGEGVGVAYLALIAAERHPLTPGPGVVEVRWFPLETCPPSIPTRPRCWPTGTSACAPRPPTLRSPSSCCRRRSPSATSNPSTRRFSGAALDTRNFRRDVLAAGVVEPVGRLREEGPGRPARLYRFTGGEFQVLARERRIARAIRHRGDGGAEW